MTHSHLSLVNFTLSAALLGSAVSAILTVGV